MDRLDFLFDNDLIIRDGDFVIGKSDVAHIKDLIISSAGWWKENPLLGVGISNYQNSGKTQELQSALKKNLEADGYDANQVKVSLDANGKFNIDISALLS